MMTCTLYRACVTFSKRAGIGAWYSLWTSTNNGFHPQLCRFSMYSSVIKKWRVSPVLQKLTKSYSVAAEESKTAELEKLRSEMNIRLANENGFLSWCRNTYLLTVVGVAMITEATTEVAMDAGFSALFLASVNIFWGTGSYITNLIRLRNASGMSTLLLSASIIGSFLHCLFWSFLLLCYIGLMDDWDPNGPTQMQLLKKDNRSKRE